MQRSRLEFLFISQLRIKTKKNSWSIFRPNWSKGKGYAIIIVGFWLLLLLLVNIIPLNVWQQQKEEEEDDAWYNYLHLNMQTAQHSSTALDDFVYDQQSRSNFRSLLKLCLHVDDLCGGDQVVHRKLLCRPCWIYENVLLYYY